MFDLLSRFLVFWARSSLQLYVCSSFYAFCVNLSQYSSNAAVLKIAIIFSVFGCWELLAIFFKGWIMFTFMSSRCATKYTDRSEAAHCRIEGCCCCSFRQVPCSCHQKKNPFISLLSTLSTLKHSCHREQQNPWLKKKRFLTLVSVNNTLMRTRSVKFCWQALLAASFVQRSSFLDGKRARAEPYSKAAAGASTKPELTGPALWCTIK